MSSPLLKLFSFPNRKRLDPLKSLKFPRPSRRGKSYAVPALPPSARTNPGSCFHRRALFPNLFPATFVFLEGPLKHSIATFHVFYLPLWGNKSSKVHKYAFCKCIMLTKCCPGSWFLPVGNGEVYSGLKPHGGPGARAEDGGEPGKPQGRGGALEMHRKEGRKPGNRPATAGGTEGSPGTQSAKGNRGRKRSRSLEMFYNVEKEIESSTKDLRLVFLLCFLLK